MPPKIRVALFTDAFDEPNGVASLSREFARYALRHNAPMMVVRGGEESRLFAEGSLTTLQLRRGPLSFPLDQDLYCDPAFVRHMPATQAAVRDFKPDLIHITGPGDMGIFGARVAHLARIPLVASWHTNLHEYAAKRIRKGLSLLPSNGVNQLACLAEKYSLMALLRFYKMARMTMAPNQELVRLIGASTGKPCAGMMHGVDLERFRPCRRREESNVFTIGYVGRLTSEKNVRRFVAIDEELKRLGINGYRFVLIGDGGERCWLKDRLPDALLPGVLRGEELADAVASFDAFVFPSETDTFGLVVLEAMASGVPPIVARGGGPQYQVKPGVNGFVAGSTVQFVEAILGLKRDPQRLLSMRTEARSHACENSWNQVFDQVHDAYRTHLFAN